MTGGGKSCVIPGCFTHTGGKKYQGISVFTIPTRKCDAEWTKKLCAVIGTYRTMDTQLKKLIADGKCYICETHFKPEEIEYTSKFIFAVVIHFTSLIGLSVNSRVSQSVRQFFTSLYNVLKMIIYVGIYRRQT